MKINFSQHIRFGDQKFMDSELIKMEISMKKWTIFCRIHLAEVAVH